MKISRFIELYRIFGSGIAWSAAAASRFKRAAPLKHRRVLDYLKENYSGFISGYKSETSNQSENSGVIWTMWWQGEENLPEVVKMCFSSFNRYKGTHTLKIITKDNYSDYIKLPDYILEKVNSGAITLTHFSDIVRFYLLYEYGGLWLDATIFVTGGIPEEIFELDYYTVRRPFPQRNYNFVKNRWTNFLHASKKGNLLCKFVLNFFLEYWKTQTCMIDYFLIDYAIYIAYTELPECRDILDSVPMVDCDLYKLESLLNKKWSLETFQAVERDTHFSKLTYKHHFLKHIFGHETFYGHLSC
ncbi:MAG: capsular polysaccharide synthesis protein [Synergistaceae bacterium]|nr:capsular polysaccharide synthesis protein [Synergistaceae bacterium]